MSADYSFSREGPKCPYCKVIQTPDEGFYFDESTTELECGSCAKTYGVQVYIETSWSTAPAKQGEPV